MTDCCFDRFGVRTTKPRVPLQSVLTALIYAHTLLVNHLAMVETDLVGSFCVCPSLSWYLYHLEAEFRKGFPNGWENGIARIWGIASSETCWFMNILRWKTKNPKSEWLVKDRMYYFGNRMAQQLLKLQPA